MRSVSLQINCVSSTFSGSASPSSNCAAPLMPESGFLISCASIADMAETERAAPRWVNCRSIWWAMERGCTTISACRSPVPVAAGETCKSTIRSAPVRGDVRSIPYSLKLIPSSRQRSISPTTGLPNGISWMICCFCKTRLLAPKNSCAAKLA